MCQICCRHKHILKSLSGDRLGRQCQMQMYSAHLKRQYEDRCLYWQARAASRMNAITADSTQQVCCIVDGMDHSKFRYPRSLAMLSKEYDFLQRPHLNMHAILAHGHMCLLSLADITVPKDASFCVELLSHCLHCISDRLDLTQGDAVAGAVRQHMSRTEEQLYLTGHEPVGGNFQAVELRTSMFAERTFTRRCGCIFCKCSSDSGEIQRAPSALQLPGDFAAVLGWRRPET